MQALEGKKLFIIDYHDFLLPYVHKVRALERTTLYGSRTLFFLKKDGTLMPIAIELTRPKSATQPQWRQVFTPSSDPTQSHLWILAKAHVGAHDSGYHELVIHWYIFLSLFSIIVMMVWSLCHKLTASKIKFNDIKLQAKG